MNGKERARLALSANARSGTPAGVPDRVPLGDFSIDYDTAERILGHETYARAKARCQIGYWEGRRDEVVQSLIEDTIALYRKLDVYDIVNLCSQTLGLVPPRGYRPESPRRLNDTTWEFADGRVYKYSDVTADITLVYDPQEWTRSLHAEQFPLEWPASGTAAPLEDPSVYELVDAVVAALGDDRLILGPFPRADQWVQPGGMARSLMEMAEHPELIDRAVQSTLARARAEQDAWTPRGIDGTLDGTDWAYRSGLFMSPRMWRRYCAPALRTNVQAAHAHGLLYVQHACGNNWAILEDLIEAGIDCYQSIQATADMDLGRVCDAVDGRMALWGGVPVERLVSGTPAEVQEDVRRALETGKRHGRFILGSTHSIAVGCRYDNFMAMLDAFERYRDY